MFFMTYAIKRVLNIGVAAILLAIFAITAFAQDDKPGAPMPQMVQTSNSRFEDRYRFGLQDRIEVQVFRHPEYSGVIDVGPDGTIFLPRIKEPVVAVCKTERELGAEITSRYSKILRTPFVQVRAAEQKSQSFAVIGEVNKPGIFFLAQRVRLLQLLALAAGPTDKAGRRVIVARTGSYSVCKQDVTELGQVAESGDPDVELLNFDLNDIKSGKQSPWMEPGDIVSVLEADQVYVVGNVNKPQPVAMKKQLTLMQAIASAEGLKPSTKKGNIRILRLKPDSIEREEIVVDLRRIEKLEVPDPILQPNDIVAISEDSTKALTKDIIKGLMGGLASLPYFIR
jgi:polysaccharide export outer membrane protein